MSIKLSLIGGGIMGEALLSRLIKQKIYSPNAVLVSEPQGQRRDFLQKTYQVNVTEDNRETLRSSEVLLLAVKPQVLDRVLAQMSLEEGSFSANTLVISILAGVSLKKLETSFPGRPVVRAMPNTPATVGAGMTALAPGELVAPEQLTLARSIFTAVGEVVEVDESLMDAVTGLSGSGPAFVALLIEALADGGVAAGLPRQVAQKLALQTVNGTAQLLLKSQLHPAELKDRVTSPGGTTIAGVAQLEKANFRSALIEAVQAAYHRSQELGS